MGDFGGRSLSVSQSSAVAINPNIPEAFALHQWRQSNGGVIPAAVSLSSGNAQAKCALCCCFVWYAANV